MSDASDQTDRVQDQGDTTFALIHSERGVRRRLIGLGALVLLLGSIYWLLADSTYQSSADFHATIEIVGSQFGILAGLALVLRFYALGNRFHLFIGLAFLVNGTEDLVHGILAFRYTHLWFGLEAATLQQFIPSTYVTGRLLLGGILLMAPFLPLWMGASRDPKKEAKWVCVIIALITALATILVFNLPLPTFIFPERLISRPIDMLSAVVLALALMAFCREYRLQRDSLIWWIAVSIGINMTGQVLMAFSKEFFDAFFDIARIYKVFGYIVPLLGFTIYQIAILRDRDRVDAKLRAGDRRYRMFADATPALIGYIDCDQYYRQVNLTFEQWFGMEREDIEGQTIRDIVGASAYAVLDPHIRAVLNGETVKFQERLSLAGVEERFVRGIFIPESAGETTTVTGFYTLIDDLSADHRRQMELEQLVKNMERAKAEMERFNQLAVGREKRMIQLKGEINFLLVEKGEPSRFDLTGLAFDADAAASD